MLFRKKLNNRVGWRIINSEHSIKETSKIIKNKIIERKKL